MDDPERGEFSAYGRGRWSATAVVVLVGLLVLAGWCFWGAVSLWRFILGA